MLDSLRLDCFTCVRSNQGQGLLSDPSQWGKLLSTVPEDIRDLLDSRWKVSFLRQYISSTLGRCHIVYLIHGTLSTLNMNASSAQEQHVYLPSYIDTISIMCLQQAPGRSAVCAVCADYEINPWNFRGEKMPVSNGRLQHRPHSSLNH